MIIVALSGKKGVTIMIDENFIGDRVTKLRLKKGVSEYRMSMDMGHSSSYIHSIASGKTLPSMGEFLYMCEYLGTTPKDFFDEKCDNPILVQTMYQLSQKLSEDDLNMIIQIAKRLTDDKT